MLSATVELSGPVADVASCQRDLKLPLATCQQLLAQAQNDPNLYYALARAAVLKYGTEACAKYVTAETGAPKTVSAAGCEWTVNNVVAALEKYFSTGGPTWRSLYAGTGRTEGVFWRKSDDPNPGPGEHWLPAHGGTPARIQLNVAILDQEGEPRKIGYVPCERMDYEGTAVEGHVRCRDVDGQMRAVGTVRPLYKPGFYGKRLEGWPYEYETHPWSPLSLKDRLLANRPEFTAEPAEVAGKYPPSSVAAYDESQRVWLIAAPVSELGGDATWRVIDQSATKPSGLPVISHLELLKRTGELPWYKDWRTWVAAGAVATAGVGGYLLWKRGKRRKRR